MAKAEIHIIQALRETAVRLEKATNYQWGHMGSCNCGFLAQVVTGRNAKDIHAAALCGHGDWSEQLNDYCPTTQLPMDQVITELQTFGFDLDDLVHLERLSAHSVCAQLPNLGIHLRHNNKQDAVTYLRAWAAMLEDQWAEELPSVPLDLEEAMATCK